MNPHTTCHTPAVTCRPLDAVPSPIRVAHVVQHLGFGGAEQAVIDLVNSFDRAFVTPSVITVYSGGPRAKALERTGVEVAELQRERVGAIIALVRLVRHLRRLDPAIVHTHTFSGAVYGRLAAFLVRRKTVHTEHGVNVPNSHYGRRGFVLRLLRRVTDATVVFTAEARDIACEKGWAARERTVIIPNGVPVTPRSDTNRDVVRALVGVSPDQTLVISVGGLREEKDTAFLIDVITELHSRTPGRYRVAIVGDGEMRRQIETKVRRYHLEAVVVLLGARADSRLLVAGADIFVNTSHWESMPISILEALASGVPVVAPAVGDIPHILAGGGGMVIAKNIEAFATAIDSIASDEPLRVRLGTDGKQNAHINFALEETVLAHERLYFAVAGETVIADGR